MKLALTPLGRVLMLRFTGLEPLLAVTVTVVDLFEPRGTVSELGDAETLKPGGVLFFSNPRGANEEGWHGERYGCYFDIERWRTLLTGAGFIEIDCYYRPTGRPRRRPRSPSGPATR